MTPTEREDVWLTALTALTEAAEQVTNDRCAAAWDEGLQAWRTYLNGGRVPPNPYRNEGP